MILFFSGTGNSRFVAGLLAKELNDEVLSLNVRMKRGDTRELKSEKPYVFVLPTYAWRIPEAVDKYIRSVLMRGTDRAYFVLTCGSNIGGAEKYIKQLCEYKVFEYMGTAKVVMPENYLAMFDTPDKYEADRIISKAIPKVRRIAKAIRNDERIHDRGGLFAKAKSGVFNRIYCRHYITDKGFYLDRECISCGKCESLCPTKNITLDYDGRPVWGGNCMHCMACIAHCPTEAIQFGKKSVGRVRYHLD